MSGEVCPRCGRERGYIITDTTLMKCLDCKHSWDCGRRDVG